MRKDSPALDEKNCKAEGLKSITDEELAIVLYKHKSWVESEGKEGEKAELIRFNLFGKNLSNANLEGAKLHGINFHKANLTGANLKNAGLKGAFFNETNLLCTDLSGAVLKFAEFKKARCKHTKFEKSDLFRANFQEAEIDCASFIDAKTGDKSLEKLLEKAKVISVYVNKLNRVNKEEEIFIIDENDDEETFLLNSLEKNFCDNKEDFDEEISDREKIKSKNNAEQPANKEKNTQFFTSQLNNLRPTGSFNSRFIVVIVVVLILLISIFFSNTAWPSSASTNKLNNLKVENENPTNEGSTDKEVPYLLELNMDKVEESPSVVLAVGSVTTLDLQEVPKEVVIGDKEVIEIRKSANNPKRLYLTGKSVINGSNVVIQTKSKTITVFFQIIEQGSVGSFNAQVKVINS